MPTSLTVGTWNVRQNKGTSAAESKANYLLSLQWDVLALQEVTPAAAEVLSRLGTDWICPPAAVHGVALAARNGIRLSAPALMASLEKPERGLWAIAQVGDRKVEVGSLHITNAVGDGKSLVKQAHYVALTDWLDRRPLTPRVLGMDANHAFDARWPDLPGSVYLPRGDEWAEEYAFFSADATHGMRDAWFDHLQRDPGALAAAAAAATERPSAVSLEQQYKGRVSAKRMDYIFTTGLGVTEVTYEQEARAAGLSDHALVLAKLVLP